MKTLRDLYNDAPTVGSVCLCNWGGYGFCWPTNDDPKYYDLEDYYVVYEDYGDGRKNFRRHVVHYTMSADNPRAYINRDRRRIYLDEVMRVW